MSPIDDELRAALRTQAATVAPAPDPLGGIESRARGMRRRRIATSVAGAALAVSAVAVAVPVLTSGTDAAPNPYTSTTPTTTVATSASLDPAHPWAFRGTLSAGTRTHFADEWQRKHPGSTMTLLFGQTYEPSGQEEAAFVAHSPTEDRYGWVTGSEGGADFLVDDPYPQQLAALQFSLPGDEAQRLVVVAAPDSTVSSTDATLTALAPGVVITPLEKAVTYTVRDASGTSVATGSAEPPAADPTNVLPWIARGDKAAVDEAAVKQAFADAVGGSASAVTYKPLYTGKESNGIAYTIGQAWLAGDAKAHTFGYATGGTNGPEPFLGPETPTNAQLVALLVSNVPGATTDLLVLVPRPGTGQLSYDSDATGGFTPVANGRSDLDGVGLVQRSRTATDDRIEQLDGDGNTDHPIYRGPLARFLCGDKECG